MKKLTAQQQSSLDAGLLRYLRRERKPVRDHSVIAHAELHSAEEIQDSLYRLRDLGKILKIVDLRLGTTWVAVTSEDDCPACEVLRLTYRNPETIMHTCRAPSV